MHLLFVFLVTVGVATSGPLKTNEELEQTVEKLEKELQFFKMKMESLEAKTASIEAKTEDIGANAELHSNFCAWTENWTSLGTITYEHFLLEDCNVADAEFNAFSGFYKSGVPGTYRLDISIGCIFAADNGKETRIYIQHNGANVKETKIVNFDAGGLGLASTCNFGSRSIMLHMDMDDYVSVRVDSNNGAGFGVEHVTFCVHYEG